MSTVHLPAVLSGQTPALRRTLAAVCGVLLVALGAQIAVPLPGTPVPLTFQVPAVLIVGGLLGPALGSASVALYLLLGIAGLPVFAPIGPGGLARLMGPTGGYLLAFPVAAALVGQLAGAGRSWLWIAVAVIAGLIAIHAAGLLQLIALGGDVSVALRLGSMPFLAGDVAKLLLAALIIRKFGSPTRALL